MCGEQTILSFYLALEQTFMFVFTYTTMVMTIVFGARWNFGLEPSSALSSWVALDKVLSPQMIITHLTN